jgi:hypothetical protein
LSEKDPVPLEGATQNSPDPEGKAYALLTAARNQREVTVRDDLFDFALLLDAVRLARSKDRRFRLIDTGRLERFELEWLLEAGAHFYTSDDYRTDITELEGLLAAASRARTQLAWYGLGPFDAESSSGSLVPEDLYRLGGEGAHIHLSNRERQRQPEMLMRLAEECADAGSRLVYYHHGQLPPEFEELARRRFWIHLAESSLPEEEDRKRFLDILRSPRTRTRFVLFSEATHEALWLRDIMQAGAFLLFQNQQFDYRSPYAPLKRQAARRRLPPRAYYLYPQFML